MAVHTARRSIVALDIVGYGSRPIRQQRWLLDALTRCVDGASAMASVDYDREELSQDNGDSECLIFGPDQPDRAVFGDFIRALAAAVDDVNDGRDQSNRLRVRIAAHHGLIEPHGHRLVGPGVVTTVRLRDCKQARTVMTHINVDAVLVISRAVFDDVIGSGLAGWSSDRFSPIRVAEKELHTDAWLATPLVISSALRDEIEALITPNATTAHSTAQDREADAHSTTHVDNTTIRAENVYFGSKISNNYG